MVEPRHTASVDETQRHRGGADNELTGRIIGAAIEVHRALGPGLLESAYRSCLCRELEIRRLAFRAEVPLPVRYKGVLLDCGYRLDLMVENRVVVELKAVERVHPIAYSQLLTYLRRVGLLINFNAEVLRAGVKRIVNG